MSFSIKPSSRQGQPATYRLSKGSTNQGSSNIFEGFRNTGGSSGRQYDLGSGKVERFSVDIHMADIDTDRNFLAFELTKNS